MVTNPRLIARANKLNPKSFPIGSVVYFLRYKKRSSEKEIWFGTVLEHYASEIAIQLYDLRDTRMIEGVPVKNFKTPSKWKKLPKGWSWDTVLFEIECDTSYKNFFEYFPSKQRYANPDEILRAIEDGALVKMSENDKAVFRTEIDSHYGWRIIREYNDYYADYVSIPYYKVYSTWEEAQKELNAIFEDNKKLSEMTDLEWSIREIDRTLDSWAYCNGITTEQKEEVRKRLMNLDDLENVEVRTMGHDLQWKYEKNKRWLKIEL